MHFLSRLEPGRQYRENLHKIVALRSISQLMEWNGKCILILTYQNYYNSAENKDYSSAGHHEQKNKKTTGQIKFLVLTVKQQIKKLVLQYSLCKH